MKKFSILFIICSLVLAFSAFSQVKDEFKDFDELNLEDLLNVEVVTASKYSQSIDEAPASVTVITKDDFKYYGFYTLSDILSYYSRGTYITTDRVTDYLGVRGMFVQDDYNTRVLVLLNGHTLNEPWNNYSPIGTDLGVEIDNIERVEIVRGPGSVLYGTAAFFCVINIITKDGKDFDGFHISTELASYQSYKGILTYGKKFGDKLDILASASYLDKKGPNLTFDEIELDSTDSPVSLDTSKAYIWGGTANECDYENIYTGLIKVKYTNFTFLGKFASRKKGVPTAMYGSVFGDTRNAVRDTRHFGELKYEMDLDKTKSIMARGYTDYYLYEDWFIYADPSYKEGGYSFFDYDKVIWFGGELQFNWQTHNNNRVMLGGEFQYRDVKQRFWKGNLSLKKRPGTFYEDPRKSNLWALYIQDEFKPINWLLISAGVHRDQYSNFGGISTPRVAFILMPVKGTIVKLIYGSAFRAPSIIEYAFDDGYWSMGNDNLKPEVINTGEINLNQTISKNFEFAISGFTNKITDIISEVTVEVDSSGNVIGPATDQSLLTRSQSQNLGNMNNIGYEAGLNSKFGPLYLFANFTHQKTEKDGIKIPNSPEIYLSFGGCYSLLKNKLTIGLTSRYLTKRLTGRESQVELEPQSITNLTLSSRKFIKGLTTELSIYNIFNQKVYDPTSDDIVSPTVFLDSINFKGKVSYNF